MAVASRSSRSSSSRRSGKMAATSRSKEGSGRRLRLLGSRIRHVGHSCQAPGEKTGCYYGAATIGGVSNKTERQGQGGLPLEAALSERTMQSWQNRCMHSIVV